MDHSYRADIDGLRAIAVLAVVGFHAEMALFAGGFAGVDVFFVISGYLITGIIQRGLKKRSFSFSEFYIRRANRILPALVVVLLSTLAVGWVVLFAAEFKNLAKHSIAGSLFVSNFVLWSEAGYFDSAAKPLLHLWSLGIEEQFYLVWPAVAFVIWRRFNNVRTALYVITVLSFALALFALSAGAGTAAFYSPLTRFWEIGVGAILSTFYIDAESPFTPARKKLNELAAVAGVILMVLTLVMVDRSTPWPGWWAILPCLATGLLLAAGPSTWIGRTILSNRYLVAIGLISYPLYLWHWPLMVLARLVNEGQLPRTGRVAIIVLSLGLAFLTYRFVESPVRFGEHKKRSAKRLVGALMVMGCLAVISFMVPNPRLATALSAKADAARHDGSYPGGGFTRLGRELKVNVIEGDSNLRVVFIGDSHVGQYWPRLVELARVRSPDRPRVEFVTHEGCPSLPGVNPTGLSAEAARYRCNVFFAFALARALEPSVRTVVIGGYWENYLERNDIEIVATHRKLSSSLSLADSVFDLLQDDVMKMQRAGKQVFLLGSNPVSPWYHPDSVLLPRRLPGLAPRQIIRSISESDVRARTRLLDARLRRIAANTGAVVIDPVDFMCSDGKCSVVDATGQPIYSDDNHIRASYARMRATFVDKTVETLH